MKFSQYFGLALASTAIAAPTPEAGNDLVSRAAAITDVDILNFALTLEHLENAFYKEALKKFGRPAFDKAGFVPRTRPNVHEIAADESTHVKFLRSVLTSLNQTAVQPCDYKFGLSNVDTFLAIAQVLEGVGVSAYLGAAALIKNKGYLTPAGSILTVEARHNAYIRDAQPHPQAPFPAAFDVPLTPNEVFTLASPFIVKCPKSSPKLPLKAFPAMSLAAGENAMHRLGQEVTLDVAKRLNPNKKYHAAFILVTGPEFVATKVSKNGKQITFKVPNDPLVAGQAYVVLSTSNKAITDANTVAGPAIVPVQAPYANGGLPTQ